MSENSMRILHGRDCSIRLPFVPINKVYTWTAFKFFWRWFDDWIAYTLDELFLSNPYVAKKIGKHIR